MFITIPAFHLSFLLFYFQLLLILFSIRCQFCCKLLNILNIYQWQRAIIGLDALTTIPFAKLRQDGRPVKFALTKVGGITYQYHLCLFFSQHLSGHLQRDPNSLGAFYFMIKIGLSVMSYWPI